MYRDDVCAVCNEALPPDHLYCREHAAIVDDLLHELGETLSRIRSDVDRAAELLDSIHPDTWDYLAEDHGDPEWPPRPELVVSTDADEMDVDVDSDPGMVTVRVTADFSRLLRAVGTAINTESFTTMVCAVSDADDTGATH